MSTLEPTIQNDSALNATAMLPDSANGNFGAVSGLAGVDSTSDEQLLMSKVVIVDDDEVLAAIVRQHLVDVGFQNILVLSDSTKAIEQICSFHADIVISDLMMPNLTGLDLLKLRSQNDFCRHVPFIIFSGNSDKMCKREALEYGATDFLSKPVDPVDLLLRVRNTLVVKQHQDRLSSYASELETEVQARTQQIQVSRERIVHCLAKAAEFRDSETGSHVVRVGKYAAVIAGQLGFDENYCRQIDLAAQLHDVGKIGIPDSILLSPGRLSREEFEVMKEHCLLGYRILEPLAEADALPIKRNVRGQIMTGIDTSVLGLAANIALTHHEKWDGTGYPCGLKNESIPIEGRITCVVDVYDALCSERPYKPKFPREKCLEIMLSERGSRFDPQVLDVFFERLDMIIAIGDAHKDNIETELR